MEITREVVFEISGENDFTITHVSAGDREMWDLEVSVEGEVLMNMGFAQYTQALEYVLAVLEERVDPDQGSWKN